jgi:3'-phosphoadenosine 5'-phosphosulfate sulfotransferase (PAPS reductase)/FAD synthetase
MSRFHAGGDGRLMSTLPQLSHLSRLEAESIHILREVVAECERPVMLYSIGKDSSVMLHLAIKAFYPAGRHFRCCTWIPPGSSGR